ncbi:MAG: hypothetical protein FWD78_17620, partial [Treponema sp.]|nr:hypothetical protein [Treponema sp.]
MKEGYIFKEDELPEKIIDTYYGLFVFLVALIVYTNSLFNGFVWDDHAVMVTNPLFNSHPLRLFSSIDTLNDSTLLPYYRPLTLLSFYMEKHIHGFNPFLVRLFNVLLHSANASLLYFLVKTVTKRKNIALLAALFFALHPLNTESVDFNAGGRNTLLACFFVFLTYLLHYRSVIYKKVMLNLPSGALFLAALLSKESALTLAPILFITEYSAFRKEKDYSIVKGIVRFLPYAAAMLIYLIMRWMTLSKLGIQTSIIPSFGTNTTQFMFNIPSLSSRLLNNIYIIPRYLLTIIWPTALSPVYSIPENLHQLLLPILLGWISIIAISVWCLTKGRSYVTFFGFCWLIVFWLPVSGIVYFPSTPLADRYLYMPAIGIWIITADQTVRFFPTKPLLNRIAKT